MKVLLISHTCQSRTEGQPKAVELAHRLDGNLLVLAPDRWKHYGKWRAPHIPQNAPFRYIAGKVAWPWTGPGQFYLHWYPQLPQILRSFRPDVIDLWEEPWSLVSAQVCWLRNRMLPHVPILSETEQNLYKPYPPPFQNFRAYTLRHADFAIARSSGAACVLRSQGYTGPLEVVPNAVDEKLFRPLDREQCRRSLRLDGFIVGYCGRLVERKGLIDLVNALPHCPPHTRLLFAGSGEYQPVLEKRLRELGLQSRAQFLPERPLEELPGFMNAIDALALPSWTVASWKEQFGRVIIEAHACGTPVIGSSSGAIPAVIGRGGRIFPERDAIALAAAITELATSPGLCKQMGEIGRHSVLNHCTWSKVADQMHTIYRRAERLPHSRFQGGIFAWQHPR